MDKQQKQIALTAGLAVVMIIAWGNTFNSLRKRDVPKTAVGPVVGPVAVKPQVSPQSAVLQIARLNISDDQDAGWGRDPFSGKVYLTKEGAAGYALTGIIWDNKNPQALINDEVYGKGAKIDKYTVEDIQSNKVILDDGVREIELTLE